MGNFSVSCGITRAAIRYRDKCVFIPIVAKKYDDRMILDGEMSLYAEHETTHLFCQNDDLWQPCLFPIHGKYNDYGGLEEIERDENTSALEKRYGLDIDDIMSILTEGNKDVYDSGSKLFKNFFLYSKEYEDGDYCWILEKLFSKRYPEEIWKAPFFEDSTFLIAENREGGFRVALLSDIGSGNLIYKQYRFDEILKFLKYYFEVTGKLVGMKNEEMCYELLCMGGMFVLEEVYEQFAKFIPDESRPIEDRKTDRLFLVDNGFTQKDSGNDEDLFVYTKTVGCVELNADITKKTLNGMDAYYVKEFCAAYEKLTSEILDLSRFGHMDEYEINKYFSKNYAIKACTNLAVKELERIGLKIDPDDKGQVTRYIIRNPTSFASVYLQNSFSLFNRYGTMKNVYLSEILSGNCIDAYAEMERFCHYMRLLNVVWIPSFCGTQDGCLEAEEKLRNILNQIVDKRLSELGEDED